MKIIKTLTCYALYTLLVAFIFCGCTKTKEELAKEFEIMEIDGCEYVVKYHDLNYFFAHKGNCKYCTERAKNNCN
jgi:hypothetical protein